MSRAVVPLALLAVAAAVAGVGLYRGRELSWPRLKERIRGEFPDVRQLSTAELAAWLARDDRPPPLLLDARSEEEYEVSHLRGAVRVDPDSEEPALPAGLSKDAPIVAYCSVGYRSAKVARRLMEEGYTAVWNLEGSIFEWANQGRPVVRGDREVHRVHPYDRRWGRLLDEDLHADSAP